VVRFGPAWPWVSRIIPSFASRDALFGVEDKEAWKAEMRNECHKSTAADRLGGFGSN
jgi:hypothetical protein